MHNKVIQDSTEEYTPKSRWQSLWQIENLTKKIKKRGISGNIIKKIVPNKFNENMFPWYSHKGIKLYMLYIQGLDKIIGTLPFLVLDLKNSVSSKTSKSCYWTIYFPLYSRFSCYLVIMPDWFWKRANCWCSHGWSFDNQNCRAFRFFESYLIKDHVRILKTRQDLQQSEQL